MLKPMINCYYVTFNFCFHKHFVILLRIVLYDLIIIIFLGNYPLCRVLAQIYEVSQEPLEGHTMALVSLLPLCDNQERLALLNLFSLIAKNTPEVSTCLLYMKMAIIIIIIMYSLTMIQNLDCL